MMEFIGIIALLALGAFIWEKIRHKILPHISRLIRSLEPVELMHVEIHTKGRKNPVIRPLDCGDDSFYDLWDEYADEDFDHETFQDHYADFLEGHEVRLSSDIWVKKV